MNLQSSSPHTSSHLPSLPDHHLEQRSTRPRAYTHRVLRHRAADTGSNRVSCQVTDKSRQAACWGQTLAARFFRLFFSLLEPFLLVKSLRQVHRKRKYEAAWAAAWVGVLTQVFWVLADCHLPAARQPCRHIQGTARPGGQHAQGAANKPEPDPPFAGVPHASFFSRPFIWESDPPSFPSPQIETATMGN